MNKIIFDKLFFKGVVADCLQYSEADFDCGLWAQFSIHPDLPAMIWVKVARLSHRDMWFDEKKLKAARAIASCYGEEAVFDLQGEISLPEDQTLVEFEISKEKPLVTEAFLTRKVKNQVRKLFWQGKFKTLPELKDLIKLFEEEIGDFIAKL